MRGIAPHSGRALARLSTPHPLIRFPFVLDADHAANARNASCEKSSLNARPNSWTLVGDHQNAIENWPAFRARGAAETTDLKAASGNEL